MDKRIKGMARLGYAAKGIVYGIIGGLTLMAALNLGGEKPDKLRVLKFIEEQPFGKVLLVIIGFGLLCYCSWRIFQAIADPDRKGSDSKGLFTRSGYFVSGILYLSFGAAAIMRVLDSGGGSKTQDKNVPFLATDAGIILIGIAGCIILGTAVRQFIKVYKQKYLEEFDLTSISDQQKRKLVKRMANFGLAARGVIFLIIGFFAVKAALDANPDEIKDTSDVFNFLHQMSYGAFLLGIVSAGLVAYAIHMLLLARYRKFQH